MKDYQKRRSHHINYGGTLLDNYAHQQSQNMKITPYSDTLGVQNSLVLMPLNLLMKRMDTQSVWDWIPIFKFSPTKS